MSNQDLIEKVTFYSTGPPGDPGRDLKIYKSIAGLPCTDGDSA
jgi:hypothetical protein